MSKFFPLLSLLIAFAAQAEISTDWNQVKVEDGVEVYEGNVVGSNVVAFKGVALIDAPLSHVLSVLYDLEQIKRWMSNLKDYRTVEWINKFKKIDYNRLESPWPLSDRDFVYNVTIHVDPRKSVDIIFENTTHPMFPKVTDVVRGDVRFGRYLVEQDPASGKVRLTVEMFADPKGQVPKWMVNMVQRSWPVRTISRIRDIATDKDFKPLPEISVYLDGEKSQRVPTAIGSK